MVVTAALDHLFDCNYFDITKLWAILEAMDMPRQSPAMTMLHPLHCMHYNKMAPELRERLPLLVREAISPPARVCEATRTVIDGLSFDAA